MSGIRTDTGFTPYPCLFFGGIPLKKNQSSLKYWVYPATGIALRGAIV